MKRRKNINKYKVDETGQITNTQPKLSPKTQKLLEFMTMMSAMSEMMGDTSSVADDEEEVDETKEGE